MHRKQQEVAIGLQKTVYVQTKRYFGASFDTFEHVT